MTSGARDRSRYSGERRNPEFAWYTRKLTSPVALDAGFRGSDGGADGHACTRVLTAERPSTGKQVFPHHAPGNASSIIDPCIDK
jgi:hypothetical protein